MEYSWFYNVVLISGVQLTQLHIYIYTFFFRFFPNVDYYRTWWMFTGFFPPKRIFYLFYSPSASKPLPLPGMLAPNLCLTDLRTSETSSLLLWTAPILHDPASIWYLCLFRKLLPWCWFCCFGTESPLVHLFVNCELLEGRNNIPYASLTPTECLIGNRYTMNVCSDKPNVSVWRGHTWLLPMCGCEKSCLLPKSYKSSI